MNEDAGNEVVVLEQFDKVQDKPDGKHPHHGMEVICKDGTQTITIAPMVGWNLAGKFVRTTDTDNGRAIFRPEPPLF